MKNKLVMVAVIIVIIIVGLGFWVNSQTWYFTPAYSQRNTVSTFLGYIIDGKDQSAYNMTSASYQKANSLASFEQSYGILEGKDTNVSFTSYAKKGSYVSVLGTTNNSNTKTKATFDFNVLNTSSSNLDSIVIVVYKT